MKKIVTLILVLLSKVSFAQINLVNNPSFETYSVCPDYLAQIYKVIDWYVTRDSPDYFNVCDTVNLYSSVPFNVCGYRTPASGNAYAGCITSWAGSEARETIGCQLITPLQIGTKYYGSFKVSLAGHGNPVNYCGTNKLGIFFSTVQYDSLSPTPICSNCAQICSDSIIIDTLNWTRIIGCFVADSNYSYISIGRFNLNALTNFAQVAGSGYNAYYFFDDVCVSLDSTYAYNYTYTGINENTNKPDILVYPNPASDYININFHILTESYDIEIDNIFGQQVFFKQKIITRNEHITIANINSNILFIKIIYKNEQFNYKLIKI